ncbi:hypothetical protein NDU88_005909 [Pleurodeles waltl]|uniref:Uncharacterized protein n=1 Tax=Pleurodeles waltl TaxID=8319 RepID=A0AAV7RKI1_PLEWA|nr:hypothetical protein NDU88_005909 [Pleurodeles waltl]
MSAVLTQKYPLGHKPLAYYRGLLDSVIQGNFPCEQDLAAAAFSVNKSFVMGAPLTLYVEHSVFAVIQNSKSTLTKQQVLGYELTPSRPSIKVVQCHLLNPATFLAHKVQDGKETNDSMTHPEGISQAVEDPIRESEALLFNGTSMINQGTGVRHTGVAVVMASSHMSREKLQDTAQLTLLSHYSAQVAELTALIEVLTKIRERK